MCTSNIRLCTDYELKITNFITMQLILLSGFRKT